MAIEGSWNRPQSSKPLSLPTLMAPAMKLADTPTLPHPRQVSRRGQARGRKTLYPSQRASCRLPNPMQLDPPGWRIRLRRWVLPCSTQQASYRLPYPLHLTLPGWRICLRRWTLPCWSQIRWPTRAGNGPQTIMKGFKTAFGTRMSMINIDGCTYLVLASDCGWTSQVFWFRGLLLKWLLISNVDSCAH